MTSGGGGDGGGGERRRNAIFGQRKFHRFLL